MSAIAHLEEEKSRLSGIREQVVIQCASAEALHLECQTRLASLDEKIAGIDDALAKLKA